MSDSRPLIELEQLRFGYAQQEAVVDACDATLRPGRVTALVGPNAAGKTTLLKLMLGQLQPWCGVVKLQGRDISLLRPAKLARVLSYVPQRSGVRFAFTVRQVVAMGAHHLGHNKEQAIDQAIEQAGLGELSGRVYTELSGGQQQRVILTRARLQVSQGGLAMLLDEPGSHLDLQHRHAMMVELKQLADQGLAVLIVLHDLDLAVRYADDAWLMDAGKIVHAGPWQHVLRPEYLSPVYGIELECVDTGGDRPLLTVAAGERATLH